VLFVFPYRGEGFGLPTFSIVSGVAVGIRTDFGEFFVPFLVLVMNHEHKE
jgi:hypothetical protein